MQFKFFDLYKNQEPSFIASLSLKLHSLIKHLTPLLEL